MVVVVALFTVCPVYGYVVTLYDLHVKRAGCEWVRGGAGSFNQSK